MLCSKPECNKEAKDRDGCTALHVASRMGNQATAVVAELIRFVCEVNTLDHTGRSPIYQAAVSKGGATVHCLLEAGAEVKDAVTCFALVKHFPGENTVLYEND